MDKDNSTVDHCGSIGPDQYWAFYWFGGALTVGICFILFFSQIDRWLYDNNAEMNDTGKMMDNRVSSAWIPKEAPDIRTRGQLGYEIDNTVHGYTSPYTKEGNEDLANRHMLQGSEHEEPHGH